MGQVVTRTLENGLRIVVEEVDSVASAAVRWLVPAGHGVDAADRIGGTTMLSEMLLRGAGGKSSRDLSDAFDRLGVQRSTDLQSHHLTLGALLVGDRLIPAMQLLTDVICRPGLKEDALEPVRQLCLQSLAGLDDDPQHQVMLKLREVHRPAPFNRHGYGAEDALRTLTLDEIRALHAGYVRPGGSILSIAGAVDAAAVFDLMESSLEHWSGSAREPESDAVSERTMHHVLSESAQLHLAMACDAPAEEHPDSLLERLAIAVLSGGTSARLFTEVRQKRSLCYTVGASYRAGRDDGVVSLYVGTTPERAQETLDVCRAEFDRMSEGVTPEEFERAVTRMKSGLVMQGESTAARASRNAADLFKLGRVRGLDEITAKIDALTADQINAYLERRTFGPFSTVTLGSRALEGCEA